ncbi:MAG: CRISPR-associated endonuclease Cas2 [Methylobacteriaceae bacterium]|jgi:CRISPR-associated protein Cas2|nr:CRISPR-associated endonuclease Cas2 [Methylobacteriaceae bacterium]
MARTLFLVCYDISDHGRLARVHKCVQAYAIGGQKSFYECLMTREERRGLEVRLLNIMEPTEDRIHFFQLDPRIRPWFYGQAKRQATQPFLIV